MNFKRINNLVGWVVFLIATSVYVLTAEKNGSLWDCGEFVASCFKLQIPHPPGAPLFVIFGRFFIILFGDNPATAAKAVNIMSALASSFTILFLFWTITHFARKIVNPVKDLNEITGTQLWSIMGAGVVGALAYTFSDSFWFSAVEGEVYALSSFFTALVFWAMLKWEHAADEPGADRWIVFIFFMMGLSIGVHLLNLLTLPAIVMIYYFKRFKPSKWGTVWAFVVGCVLTGIVQKAVIQYSVNGAGVFDIFAVNTLGLPFFSGFAFYFVALAALLVWGLRMKAATVTQPKLTILFAGIALLLVIPFMMESAGGGAKFFKFLVGVGGVAAASYFVKPNALRELKLILWCFAFMLIGYSSYLTTMIRSSADPGVDMYNVDNPMSLVGYLGREQYGDFPLLYGQVFTAQNRNISREEGKMRYQKSKDSYIELGKDVKEKYAADDMMFFPRVWDRSNDQQHADYYAQFLGIAKNEDPRAQDPDTGPYERRPSFFDNIRFFVGYQTYWMYMRYFMWNFSGKQNDVQGSSPGNVRDGNWITGISLIDNLLYGDQSALPETIKKNKAHNKMFALPFILGLLGLFYHYQKQRKDFYVSGLLFFFTGMAIVFYLNAPGNQPRERDYAYVGSFYAFAIWIGLAVPMLVDLVVNKRTKMLQSIAFAVAVSFVVFAVPGLGGNYSPLAIILLGLICIGVLYGLYYLLSGLKNNEALVSKAAFAICLLAAPVLMASQEWDDHDRSNKTMAPDLAKDYLESCAPNSILFSFGDNDTYPLWYAQEVQGVRPDIRVINYSLLGIDWYINQLRYKINGSDAMDVIWSADQIEGDKLNYAFVDPRINGAVDLYDAMKNWVGTSDPAKMYNAEGESIPIMPSNKFTLPVDMNVVKSNGTVMASDTAIVDTLKFEISRNALMKNDLAVLAIIAANKWKRPICFTSKFDELGFAQYLRRDGMTYRLVPMANQEVNTEWAYEKMMHKFAFGNADKQGVYFDEENRRHLNNIRQAYADLSISLSAKGQKEEARKALNHVDKMMLESNMPYGLVSRYNLHNQASLMMLEAAYRADDKALATKISSAVRKELNEEMNYYGAIGDQRAERMSFEIQRTQGLLQFLAQMESTYNPSKQEQGLKIHDSLPKDSGK